jgi:hypothetical protein
VVNFNEALKCLAKGVLGLNVDMTHPEAQGTMHEWFAATLIQSVVRGKQHRKAAAMKRKGAVAAALKASSRCAVVAAVHVCLGACVCLVRLRASRVYVSVSFVDGVWARAACAALCTHMCSAGVVQVDCVAGASSGAGATGC